ncbi:unnamed protein product, partial [Chrysoparadoxa australica]
VVTFNKCDILPADSALEWMNDFEKFQEALDGSKDESYISSLNRSLSLVLDEFYNNLKATAVSAGTGEGMDELMQAIDAAADEYATEYLPDLQRRMRESQQADEEAKAEQLRRLRNDMSLAAEGGGGGGAQVRNEEGVQELNGQPSRCCASVQPNFTA